MNMSRLTFRYTNKWGLQPMRRVTLIDNSSFSVQVTLWGHSATSFWYDERTIVYLKAARVRDYASIGRQLCFSADCIMEINPKIRRAHNLRKWFNLEWNQTYTKVE